MIRTEKMNVSPRFLDTSIGRSEIRNKTHRQAYVILENLWFCIGSNRFSWWSNKDVPQPGFVWPTSIKRGRHLFSSLPSMILFFIKLRTMALVGHPCIILLNVSKSSNVVCFLVSLQVRCALYFVLVAEAETYPQHFVETLNNGVYFWPHSPIYMIGFEQIQKYFLAFFAPTSQRVFIWKICYQSWNADDKKLAAHFLGSVAEFTVLYCKIYGKYLWQEWSPQTFKSPLGFLLRPLQYKSPSRPGEAARDIISERVSMLLFKYNSLALCAPVFLGS